MSVLNDISFKICGMRDHRNIMDVAKLNPQYMGFIFYDKSPRFVGNGFSLPPTLSSSIRKVGVFVNESTKVIAERASLGFDFIQLHGNETAEQCAALRDTGLKIIKAFSIDKDFDFRDVSPYKKNVQFFLFDTRGKLYGGNAETFDWKLLKKYDHEVPFFLSGGLTPENIAQLGDVSNMNLHALDLNSGVEKSPGMKSMSKVGAALRAFRSPNNINT